MKNIANYALDNGNVASSATNKNSRLHASDMIGSYKWYINFEQSLNADEEHHLLNRANGFEMLNFINQCAEKWHWKQDDVRSCMRLERIILFNVPDEYMTEKQVRTWVEKHFSVIEILS